MTVRATPWKSGRLKGRWQVDIRFKQPDGSKVRDRTVHEAPTVTQARRYGEAREAQLRAGTLIVREKAKPSVATLAEFAPRFLGWAKAERQKASGIDTKKNILKNHLLPALGSTALDVITDEKVAKLKASLADRNRKTLNNVLTVLSKLLKVAVEWKVIERMPCAVRLVKVSNALPAFYEFDDYARLVEGARKVGTREAAVVLLGGDAGLRRGEMMGLRWSDVDFRRNQLRIEQAAWKRTRKEAARSGDDEWAVDSPKSGRGRVVPMTKALSEALQKHRHLRGERVLCQCNGSPAPGYMIRDWLEAAQRRAGLEVMGSLHKLRHTFCSHLAMKGAPPKAIQELAGHESLSTTLRYMHLAESARDAAIALLNARPAEATVGATVGQASMK